MTIAVYPGTFDPIHYGHLDIARRAAGIFERLIVAIYDRPQKSLLFPVEDRLRMAQLALGDVPNVSVCQYNTLTVDLVRQQGATVMVRGLRVISDFELEYQMALMNRKLAPDVEMVCLMTSIDYAFISSSLIKEIAAAGGPVGQFVPSHVAEALRARLTSRR